MLASHVDVLRGSSHVPGEGPKGPLTSPLRGRIEEYSFPCSAATSFPGLNEVGFAARREEPKRLPA